VTVHGSAPDIAGKKIANPIATIWSAAMMMDHLGQPEVSNKIMQAIEIVLKQGIAHTPDMSGKATTKECGYAIVDVLNDILK
jgi:tartrate dehydrogenase/decarboxylase/D-malate dehydrogenase